MEARGRGRGRGRAAQAQTFDLEAWNSANPTRVPAFNLRSTRPHNPNAIQGQYNQHTLPDVPIHMDRIYDWIMQVIDPRTSQPTGLFTCWELKDTVQGVDLSTGGYPRINMRSKRILASSFVWLYFHPGQMIGEQDISHRCNNVLCVRPSHLVHETRAANIARRGCQGFAQPSETDEYIKYCQHDPYCCVETIDIEYIMVPRNEFVQDNV